MTTHTQNVPIPTLTNRFSPYIIHKLCFFESLPCDFRNRYYKHIHSLSLKPEETFLKRIPLPKTLHSLNTDGWWPRLNPPNVKKLVKPYKKYLKNLQGSANHPETLKLLSLLSDLEVNLTEDGLRILSFHSNLKKLRFSLLPGYQRNVEGEVILMKNKARLSRSLAKIKHLKNLSMVIMDSDVANLLLEMIDQNLSLDSLEQLGLKFISGLYSKGSQKLHANISKVLTKLTYLNSENSEWYSFITSSGKLDNLSVLELKLLSKEMFKDSKGLLQFHIFPKLQKFTLDFTAHSLPAEKNFFENFTLPLLIQDLTLTLTGFRLSVVNGQFFKRLGEAKGLKALNFTVHENAANSELIAKFTCLFIKCFENLEILNCPMIEENGCFGEDPYISKPIVFQEFWKAAGNSKETIQNISVCANEIVFPEDISVLETGFPKLQKLQIQDSSSSATDLDSFCQKILNFL